LPNKQRKYLVLFTKHRTLCQCLKIGEFGSFWGIYGCFLCKNVTVSLDFGILFGYGVMCFVSNRLGNKCKKDGAFI